MARSRYDSDDEDEGYTNERMMSDIAIVMITFAAGYVIWNYTDPAPWKDKVRAFFKPAAEALTQIKKNARKKHPELLGGGSGSNKDQKTQTSTDNTQDDSVGPPALPT
jgi:hypothetical protein